MLLAAGIFIVARAVRGTKSDGGGTSPSRPATAAADRRGAAAGAGAESHLSARRLQQPHEPIFKFYYQTWALLGVASAYGVWSVVSGVGERPLPQGVRAGLGAAAGVLLALGLVFPLHAIPSRMFDETGRINNPQPPALTLDGGPSLTNANDYAALICLRDLTDGLADIVPRKSVSAAATTISRGSHPGGWRHQPPADSDRWQGHERHGAVGLRGAVARVRMTSQSIRGLRGRRAADHRALRHRLYRIRQRRAHPLRFVGELKFRESLDVVCEAGEVESGTRIYRTSAANPAVAANRNKLSENTIERPDVVMPPLRIVERKRSRRWCFDIPLEFVLTRRWRCWRSRCDCWR